MRRVTSALALALACVGARPARSQEPLQAQQPSAQAQAGIRAMLVARGLPEELAAQVDSVAVQATATGLPSGPLADKAVEGWAKHVPATRIVAAIRLFATRMGDARAAVRDAGVSTPDGALISAAAEAMGSGLTNSFVGDVVRAAPEPRIAAPALTVAAALRAQGFSNAQAVSVVSQAERSGQSMSRILDIPSIARQMESQGMTPTEAGHHILEGTNPLNGPGSGDNDNGGGGRHGGGGPGGGGEGGHHDGGGGQGGPPLPRPPRPGLPLPHP